jgi:hypothetical protein
MRRGRTPALQRRNGWCATLRNQSSGHLPKQLGGSTPAASTPHRGARFAFDAMVTIGRQKPGSIRPPRQSCQECQQDLLRTGNALLSAKP